MRYGQVASAIGGVGLNSLANQAGTSLAPEPESEVDRELGRLDSMNGALAEHVEELQRKLQRVVHQNPMADVNKVGSAPVCGSKLGGEINVQVDRLTSSVTSLRYLIDALAI